MNKHLKFVESIVQSGGRIRERTVYAHLPDEIIAKTDKIVSKEGIPRCSALFMVLTGTPRPKCLHCGKSLVPSGWPVKQSKGYKWKREHCSSLCAGANPDTDKKRQKTYNKVYGVSHGQSVPEIRDKFLAAMVKNHGVQYSGQSDALIEKRNKTMADNAGSWDKAIANRSKKAKQTWLKNYGVDHPSKNREFFESNQIKSSTVREFTLDSKTFRVRGYEPQAIKHLYGEGIGVKNILTTAKEGVPSIPYKLKDKYHVYHPDIYAKHKRKWTIFEVKSSYTCGITKSSSRTVWSRNKKKLKATVAAGYTVKLILVSQNGKCLVIDNPHLKTRKDLIDISRLQLRLRQV